MVRDAQDALLTIWDRCHLALDLGGVFRVGFTDHAVAAVPLGGVEAGIGAFE